MRKKGKALFYIIYVNPNEECCEGHIIIYKFNENGLTDSLWSANYAILKAVHNVLLSNSGDNLFVFNRYHNSLSRKFYPGLEYVNSKGVHITYGKKDFTTDFKKKNFGNPVLVG